MFKAIRKYYHQKSTKTQAAIQFGLAVLISILIISYQLSSQSVTPPHSDALAYLNIALDIHDTGTFTDGDFNGVANKAGPNDEGMFFSPLYPFFLSLIMKFDTDFYQMSTCLTENISLDKICDVHIGGLIIAQGIIAIVSLLLVWTSALIVTGKKSIAWVSMIFASLAECYSYYAALALNENLVFPLFTLFCLLLVLGFKKRKWQIIFLAGIVLGLTALTRPSFPYVAYTSCFIAILLAAWIMLRGLKNYNTPALLMIFFMGYVVSVTPWIIRNGITLGEYAISSGYAPFILVQRAAYNEMTGKEFAASFVYGLPDFGDTLAKKLFHEENYKRFRYSEPSGFYRQGNGEFKENAIREAGGDENLLKYLLETSIFGNAIKHILVTFSLVWSGMWVSKYWGLITIPIFLAVLGKSIYNKNYNLLIYALPAWFMLGFNAFTSVNVVRYNLILIPCLAIAAGTFVIFAFDAFKKKNADLKPKRCSNVNV